MPDLHHRTIILVDDGLATGSTIIHRTAGKAEPPQHHSCGMGNECTGQKHVIDPVILTEVLPPQENSVNRAQSVQNHGEQKVITINQTDHEGPNLMERGASGKPRFVLPLSNLVVELIYRTGSPSLIHASLKWTYLIVFAAGSPSGSFGKPGLVQ